MIDHIVLWLRGPDCQKVRQHPLLKFNLIVEEETGEDKCKSYAALGPMKVLEQSPNFIKIKGSLHKLRSWIRDQVSTNHDQFTFPELFETIHWLTDFLGVPANAFEVKVIEVGLNLKNPPFDATQAFQSMRFHRGREFTIWSSGKGAVVTHSKYSLKFYDKGRQMGNAHSVGNILRVERKATHLEAFKPAPVQTLADLLDRRKLEALFCWLIKPFSNIIVFDPGLNSVSFGKCDAKFCDKARSVGYWRDLSPPQREKQQAKLRALIRKHCNPSMIQMITEECKKTFEALKTGGGFSTNLRTSLTKIGGEFSKELDSLKIENGVEFAPSSKQAESPPNFHGECGAILESPAMGISLMPAEPFLQSQSNFDKNNFVKYLQMLFAQSTTMHLVKLYRIGTSKHLPGATVFWQVDAEDRVRSGKIMLLDSCTGRKTNQSHSREIWVHSVLGLQDYQLRQCLFGEHLLAQFPDKPVAIVENEKTAIVCSVFFPGFVWLASGDQGNLTADLLMPLKDREVEIFPDLGAYDQWKAVVAKLKGYKKLEVSDYLEKGAAIADRQEGYDLADLLVNPDPETGFALTVTGYPAFWDYQTPLS